MVAITNDRNICRRINTGRERRSAWLQKISYVSILLEVFTVEVRKGTRKQFRVESNTFLMKVERMTREKRWPVPLARFLFTAPVIRVSLFVLNTNLI